MTREHANTAADRSTGGTAADRGTGGTTADRCTGGTGGTGGTTADRWASGAAASCGTRTPDPRRGSRRLRSLRPRGRRPRSTCMRPFAAGPGVACAMVAFVLVLAARVEADPLPRVAHVGQALAAVRSLGPAGRDRLDRAIYEAARLQCRADAGAPTASCLITAARGVCAIDPDRARCEAAADVVVVNLRAATTLIDEATRFRLVRGSTDYHAALAAELRRRHATLAAELVLSGSGAGGAGPDAAALDGFCARRDRALHACQAGDPACVPSLPWSRCIAALVWFVGGGT
jgi:hypothetical protein